MRTIAIVNKKGGVGKTRTALEMAYILATNYGFRVLLSDGDGQANATKIMMEKMPKNSGMAAIMRGQIICYADAIDHTEIPNLDILSASDELDDMDLEFMLSEEKPCFRSLSDVRDAVIEDDAYDFMIIDCPPHYSATCINAIAASDAIVIPTTTDAFATTGMDSLVSQIENVRKICPTVRVSGCLLTRFSNDAIDQDAMEYLKDTSPVHVFDTVIRESTAKVKGASWAMMTAQEWSPWCNASRDYRAWVHEFLVREGLMHE